ncbi:uncharacterized protein [Typha latifolia]|uniref:uncharacterized protein n=1 Tax=Typha latifolia TaxID=4733 RepID=UPI003C2CE5B5
MEGVPRTATLFILQLFLFFFSGLSQSDPIPAPMEKTEQEALYTVIQGFVGKWWNGSELYPDPCGWTPIQGVSCDLFEDKWYVTVLNIGPIFDNSLECVHDAEFSSYLFELKHIKSLSVFNCFSSVTNPTTLPCEDWQKLSGSLETLEFRSNQGLVGVIPSSFGLLANLKSLVLVENALSGELPQELDNLVHLRRLSLPGNRLSGQIPNSLGNHLSDLLILDLSRNSLTGPLPPSIGNMNSLLKLDLNSNHLDGELPWELSKLKVLTLLDLRNNNISGGWIRSLQGMMSVEHVLLSNNPMGGNLMDFEWKYLRNLATLELSNMLLTGKIPESMTELKRLRFLALNNNHLYGSVPSKIADLPCLRALYINENNLTGELVLSQVFYERVGRRFASWSNPNLCYIVGLNSTRHIPIGLEKCKHKQLNPFSDVSTETSMSDGNTSQGSSLTVSFRRLASVWWLILMKDMIVAFLLVVPL